MIYAMLGPPVAKLDQPEADLMTTDYKGLVQRRISHSTLPYMSKAHRKYDQTD